MTTKTITDQAGDTVRISTGTLTAPTGHVTVKVNEHYLGREYSAAAHADPAALRAALDEVAPLGKYTRTTPDPDDMDGGVAAALIEQDAEESDAAPEDARQYLAARDEQQRESRPCETCSTRWTETTTRTARIA